MFLVRRPTNEQIESFLREQATLPFSYPEQGATQRTPPAGFDVDHNRVLLGKGEETFVRAVAALRTWMMFDLGWVRAIPQNSKIEPGVTVAVEIRHFGIWSLNSARVIYMVDEDGPTRRFGFAYGTLPGHAECGEERFLIEWNKENGSVWYDLFAFSRPRAFLARAGYPLVRMLQRRFVRNSFSVMQSAVKARSR